MTAFVLDVSVTMAWCFRDVAADEAWVLLERLAADTAIVRLFGLPKWPMSCWWQNVVEGSIGRKRESSFPD